MKTVAGSRLASLVLSACFALLSVVHTADAFEAIGGRFQAHGYFEMQVRTISADYVDQWDVTQWYNVFNLELELDMVQDTHGPLDLLSAFVRIEARYDCIYSRGCGMVKGVDVYGNRARRMPRRLNAGDDFVNSGTIFIANDGPFANEERDPLLLTEFPAFKGIFEASEEGLGGVDRSVLVICDGSVVGTGGNAYCPQDASVYKFGRVPARFWEADRNKRNRAIEGDEAIDDGTSGAPFLIAMQDFSDFKFSSIPVIGGSSNGHPLLLMGPWLPENKVVTNAAAANMVNPLDGSRVSPQSLAYGAGATPLRPIPIYREADAGRDTIYINQQSGLGNGSVGSDTQRLMQINETTGRFGDVREWSNRDARSWEPHGIFTPSAPLSRALMEDKFSEYPFNISEIDRAFNRGASQNDEGELKEAYLDIEMFDSRLWLRIGKQSIVWGKTELFRTTDQFNPQDFALATLPSLEESRINLWALRGVWSFYEVGPLSDVRIELAMNFDEFEPADLGSCGEPYSVNLICALTFGSFAHGLLGIGVAGFATPPNPWEDARGIEFGGRAEWRWDRFSFAITDFYGYSDFPHIVRLSTYNRNVDWRTGRPRYYMHDVGVMSDPSLGCARPANDGVVFPDNPYGGPDLTQEPLGADSYVEFNGAENAGCLTRAPSNRTITNLEAPDGSFYGVPYRIPTGIQSFGNNDLQDYSGSFFNDQFLTRDRVMVGGKTVFLEAEERYQYSQALSDPFLQPVNEGWRAWSEGPNAQFCSDGENPDPRLAGHPACDDPLARRGRRHYVTQKFITVGTDPNVPNPDYNPFYDPRVDVYFDVSQVTNFDQVADPGGTLTATPVRFDPFQAKNFSVSAGPIWWMNAYNPDLEFDLQTGPGGEFSRNALDSTPVNLSVFNWVCSTTVGFSDLDPSACALNVFSSTKEPGGSNDAAPRISFIISAFFAGDPFFNGFLGRAATDELLSKGPSLPKGFGMPLLELDPDYEIPDGVGRIGEGLGTFRTVDSRRDWQDRQNLYVLPNNPLNGGTPTARSDPYYPWIYAREAESYNCLPPLHVLGGGGGPGLCGGLIVNLDKAALSLRYRSETFLSKSLTPEQEALIGCGPYFFTSCDGNGADLLWAEGSAILQSFMGNDSKGVAMSMLGIQHLVPASFGRMFMDNGSPSQEYRTDGRVVDLNGNLIRIGDEGSGLVPVLGSKGLIDTATSGFFGNSIPGPGGVPAAPCDITTDAIVDANGDVLPSDRTSARCWDLRPYFVAYGVMPGTATFEILGLGGPKCTTADLGGPLNPRSSVLPGCRNKWDTVLYQPLDSWDGVSELHPNNPDAGYIGNNFYATVPFSYKSPVFRPESALPVVRSDYRQWSSDPSNHVTGMTDLANEIDCGTGTPSSPGSQFLPENYDCYLYNPVDYGLSGLGLSASVRLDLSWASGDPRYLAAEQSLRSGLNWGVYDPNGADCLNPSPNDPSCYLGGWQQTVDGNPDRLGVGDAGGTLTYPQWRAAIGLGDGSGTYDENALAMAGLFFGERVENGCTPGSSWVFLQRTADNRLINPPECANVFTGPEQLASGPLVPDHLKRGTGHPFTGESWSSEIAGLSWNLMTFLVTFSEDFSDGLASVRGYVNPEIYESRYIYDEEWMWNPECGFTKPIAECGGRAFIPDPSPPPLLVGTPHSVYGDPNRDLDGNDIAASPSTARIRQLTGWRSTGIANIAVSARPNAVPNPLPSGIENTLQRDPSLPNILTDFPDLLMFECKSAAATLANDPSADVRTAYENCGTAANGGAADYKSNGVEFFQRNQILRLGKNSNGGDLANGTSSLLQTMQWDYAYTGTENDMMAMIPFCENLEFTQRHTSSTIGDDSNQGNFNPDIWGPSRIDCSEARRADGSIRTLGRERCTYVTPQYCDVVQAIFGVAGQKRNTLAAGGNGLYGRRTTQWQSGSEIYLSYDKRNVLGFSMDFAEDRTKSSWGVEFTWIEGVPQTNNNAYNLTTDTDDFNLTVSVDRPTFVNFLNANRTFFINSQWFFQYRKGWQEGMTNPGPWNVLATFAVFTGYFQDRLNPTLVFVYDFQSGSGGALPQLNYRFSENFSVTVGASVFMGSQKTVVMPVNPIGPAVPRSGPNAYRDGIEPGLSLVRDRDEVFMTLRYTF